MKQKGLSTEDRKRISSGALLDVIAVALPGPFGITLPIIGNILLAIDDKKQGGRDPGYAGAYF